MQHMLCGVLAALQCGVRHAEHIPHLCPLGLFQHLFKFLVVLIIWFGSRKTGRPCHEVRREFSNSCTGSLSSTYLHIISFVPCSKKHKAVKQANRRSHSLLTIWCKSEREDKSVLSQHAKTILQNGVQGVHHNIQDGQ